MSKLKFNSDFMFCVLQHQQHFSVIYFLPRAWAVLVLPHFVFQMYSSDHDQQMFTTFLYVYAFMFVNTEKGGSGGWGGDITFTAGNRLRIDCIYMGRRRLTTNLRVSPFGKGSDYVLVYLYYFS